MLEQTIANIIFKNPIIAASGCFGFGMEYKDIFDPNILGGVTLQTFTLEATPPLKPHRITEVKGGVVHATGWENPGVEYFTKILKLSLEKNFNIPIIASIGGGSKKEYQELAQKISVLPSVAALELNVSCLNTPAASFSTREILDIVKGVIEDSCKPVFLKLQPVGYSLVDIIKEAEQLGIAGFTLINNVPGIKIDTQRQKKPILGSHIGGLGGSSLMSLALATVFQARKHTKLPIIGTGGVDTLNDALEFLLAGANLVGIGSGFFKNPLCAVEIIEAFPLYLKEQKISHIKDIIGLAHA